MKGSVSRYCEPVSQGPLVPGHTDDWVFKLSRLGLSWFQNREKRTPTEKLWWEPLTLKALWHGIMKSAFPHSLFFVSFAWWACLCLLACWAQFITSDETQTRVEFTIYSLRVDPEVLVFSVFYSMNTRISTTQSLGPTICILLYLLYLTSLHISVHSKFHIIFLCISK